jgi:hypothetical protein
MAYVYIFRSGDENLFKIGKSVDVEDRIRGLATGNPRLAVFDKIETEDQDEWETCLHKRLRSSDFVGLRLKNSSKSPLSLSRPASRMALQSNGDQGARHTFQRLRDVLGNEGVGRSATYYIVSAK